MVFIKGSNRWLVLLGRPSRLKARFPRFFFGGLKTFDWILMSRCRVSMIFHGEKHH